MGVFTFVCRKSGGEWEAKQHKGELEGSAASTYDLERQLVSAAYAKDPCGGVQSSFTMVSPDSAVCQVIIGAAAAGPAVASAGGAAASGGGAAEAPKAEEKKKEEEKEESEDDLGFSLFD
ncbi:hypothetical protein QYE76_035760 [Lolium multiflorum]|uniref:60S acidic ribosomal protein P3 n=1 Tax=Lolium multiflorum TaxID=4521 RepID=A0AAD8R1G6_LOLMU|nr:60S acidic ribosomal protein P3-like [Lolium rigidum]XP_047074512.1 60S acidic ribosomal protein P3-like [Lolium rigidum]XP_051199003.1 60S acidic ribosomal protein P3-like [Lolium perenne]KAK1612087.1 hypothetical protein QYE76_035760 [Lolium multiflorum]